MHLSPKILSFCCLIYAINLFAIDKTCNPFFLRDEEIIHRDYYRAIEKESPERRDWLKNQYSETQKYNQSNKHYSYWHSFFEKFYSEIKIIKKIKIDDNTEIQLIDLGFDKPNEIRLYKNGKQHKLLFSTASYENSNDLSLQNFWIDPLKKNLLLPVFFNGSTDEGTLLIYNIRTGKLVDEPIEGFNLSQPITWLSHNEFSYSLYIHNERIYRKHRLGKHPMYDTDSSWKYKNDPNDQFVYFSFDKTKTRIQQLASYKSGDIDAPISKILDINENRIIAKTQSQDGWDNIVQIKIKPSNENNLIFSKPSILEQKNGLLQKYFNLKEYQLFHYLRDEKQWINLFDLKGRFLHTIEIPSHCYLSDIKIHDREKMLFTFSSKIKKNTNFIFNIRNKKFEQDIDSEMLTDLDGNIYENKILQIQAKDGAFFPVKLFFRSGLKLDGNNPTFVEGYGGFNVNSYFHDSYYSASRATFIQSGGIWVAPILRGDGDLGSNWGEQAQFEKKQNTFNDMIATLEFLIEKKYSNNQKIAIMGNSNGGLLISSVLTQRPDLFKLAIPINGIHDMLRKEALDPRFGSGWSSEYGNSNDAESFKYLAKYSPINNIQEIQYPSVLTVVGTTDSRVNPAHSYKLHLALKDAQKGPNPILLLPIENAGHSVASSGDHKTVLALSTIFATIYKELGMELPH